MKPGAPLILRPLTNRAGTTLLEILIVVSLIGIVATIMVPSGASSTQPYRVIEQARNVHAELARLRARSVAEQREFRVELAGDGTVAIQREEDDDSFATTKTIDLPDGVTAQINDADAGSVVFYPSGRVSTASAIVIADAESEHTIRILASGMARWESRSL